jgi:hypothetical protein
LRVYCLNYNGVLDGVMSELHRRGQLTDNYHSADICLTWQDVRGDARQFTHLMRNRLKKPVFVMQHGRGATRDYLPPNSFEAKADGYFVWGESEKKRLLKAGVAESRIHVVGCPLFKRLVRKQPKDGINVLYAPVISSKEEPENLLVHLELKKWEANNTQRYLRENFKRLKGGWATENTIMRGDKVWKREIIPTVPRGIIYSNGLVNVKLSSVHDMNQYQSPLIVTRQDDPAHVNVVADVLSKTDVLVCLEEGTMQLMAYAMDIPTICLDIFKYGEYGGVKDYDKVETIRTSAAYWIKDLNTLGRTIDHALSHQAELRKARIKVCEDEGGAHLPDPDLAVISALEAHLGVKA